MDESRFHVCPIVRNRRVSNLSDTFYIWYFLSLSLDDNDTVKGFIELISKSLRRLWGYKNMKMFIIGVMSQFSNPVVLKSVKLLNFWPLHVLAVCTWSRTRVKGDVCSRIFQKKKKNKLNHSLMFPCSRYLGILLLWPFESRWMKSDRRWKMWWISQRNSHVILYEILCWWLEEIVTL